MAQKLQPKVTHAKEKKERKKQDGSLPFLRIHIPTSTYFHPASLLVSFTRQNPRQIILVHKISLFALSASQVCCAPHILLLILGEDELCSPSTLASTTFPFSVGAAGDRFRDTEPVATVIPLHVFLEMHCELSVGVCGAGNAREGIFPAARTELLVHVFGSEETGMAAHDEGLEVADSLQRSGRKQIQVHLEKNVLTLGGFISFMSL